MLLITRFKPFFLILKVLAAPHQIRLLKPNHHFDDCTSFPAFVNRSYYCLDCERGFNTKDSTNHSCQGHRCRACGRFDCPDYIRGTRPTDYCTHCHSMFYGIHYKRHHFEAKLCQKQKTCLRCQAQYAVFKRQRHRCGYAKCPTCHEWVFINDHKFYIQPVVEEERDTEEPTDTEGEVAWRRHPLCSSIPILRQYLGRIGEPIGSSLHHQCGHALLFSKTFGTKTYQSGSTQTCH